MTCRSVISQSNPLIIFDMRTSVSGLTIVYNTRGLKLPLMIKKTKFLKLVEVGNYVSTWNYMSLRYLPSQSCVSKWNTLWMAKLLMSRTDFQACGQGADVPRGSLSLSQSSFAHREVCGCPKKSKMFRNLNTCILNIYPQYERLGCILHKENTNLLKFS